MNFKAILFVTFVLFFGSAYSQPATTAVKATPKLDWLVGSWQGTYKDAPFYESWRKVNDSVYVNFTIEIKGTDTIVKENGGILLTPVFRGFLGKTTNWELVSLTEDKIVLKNDTSKYANRITWSHSADDHWLTEIINPGGNTINYDMQKVPWLEPATDKFILRAGGRR